MAYLLSSIAHGIKEDFTLERATAEFILLIQKLRHCTDEELAEVVDIHGTKREGERDHDRKMR